MPAYTDSLRGYGYPIHKRDRFRCKYCDLGCSTWPNWLALSVDHLLPKDHRLRDETSFIVTACMFCNTADNQYFKQAGRRGLNFDGMTPQQLVEQRRPYVERVRKEYREFWESNVRSERRP